MKHVSLILIIIASAVMLGCYHNDSEPITETTLPINRQYVPETTIFQRSDKEFFDKIQWLNEKKFVVNAQSDFPDDRLGFSNAYKNIDFSRNTLLLYYRVHDWKIDAYQNIYFRNNLEHTYIWNIHIGTSTIPDSHAETLHITRFAILVSKVPEDAEMKIFTVLSAINWGWEE